MRPSLVTPTLNPCLFPSSVTVSSIRLGFPSTLFTTGGSNPEDFVNTSTDFSDAPAMRFESASPAPVSVAARRNSLRLETAFMTSLSDILPDGRSPETWQTRDPASIPALSFLFPKSSTLCLPTPSGSQSVRGGSLAYSPPPRRPNSFSQVLLMRPSAVGSSGSHPGQGSSLRIASAPHLRTPQGPPQ